MSEFGIQAFQQIALNEQESKEGKITQEIVESLKNDNKNDFFTALAKKVGNRGVQVNFKDKKEQLLKLASAISKSPEVDAEFESLEPAKNEVEANQQAWEGREDREDREEINLVYNKRLYVINNTINI